MSIYSASDEPRATSDYNNPYMFTGREHDSETGLYYYRARYYSPAFGRFLQTDPIGYADSINLYIYVGNNPLNWVDPYGYGAWGAFLSWIGGTGWDMNVEVTEADNLLLAKGFLVGAGHGAVIAANEYTFGLIDPLNRFASEKVCEYGNWGKASKLFAGGSRDAALTVAGMRFGAWFGNTKAGYWLNNNRYLRIGPGNIPKGRPFTLGPGQNVPTLRIGSGTPTPWNHFDLRMRIPGIGVF